LATGSSDRTLSDQTAVYLELVKDAPLRRYWIELETPVHGMGAFGVTAIDLDDARTLIITYLVTHLGGPDALPGLARVIEDVDVSTLDANHVLPNSLPSIWRGVWFPWSSLA
jgi:hypothetical protein